MPSARATPARILSRGLRGRCPACGVGFVFLRGLASERRCLQCGWRLERGPGHWVGGSEINMLVTFVTAVSVGIPVVLVSDSSPAALAAAVVLTAALSLALYR